MMMMINSFNLQCSTSRTSDNCHRKITPATQILLHRSIKNTSSTKRLVGQPVARGAHSLPPTLQPCATRYTQTKNKGNRFHSLRHIHITSTGRLSSFISPFPFSFPFFLILSPSASTFRLRHDAAASWGVFLDEFSE